jgi:hypothetical protein
MDTEHSTVCLSLQLQGVPMKMNPSFEECDVLLFSYLYKKKLKKSALSSSTWKYRFCVLRNNGRLFYYPNHAVPTPHRFSTAQQSTGNLGRLANVCVCILPPQSVTPLGFMDTYAVQIINESSDDDKIACWDVVGS